MGCPRARGGKLTARGAPSRPPARFAPLRLARPLPPASGEAIREGCWGWRVAMATRSLQGAAPSASRLLGTGERTPGDLRPGRAAEGVCSRGAARAAGRPGGSRVREVSASCLLSAWLSAPGAPRARTPGGPDRPLGSEGQPGTLVRDARAPFLSPRAVCARTRAGEDCARRASQWLPGVGGGGRGGGGPRWPPVAPARRYWRATGIPG